MRHLRSAGYPVPAIFESSGADLVMQRIDGPTMLGAFPRQPWRLRSWAKILASLHNRLQDIPLPAVDLPHGIGSPEVLVHGDLHPDNVMLSADGPIVIDWPNVNVGARGADVATTWILLATSEIDATGLSGHIQSAGRSLYLRTFLGNSDLDLARSLLPKAAAHRLQDRNLRPGEVVNIHELLNAEAGPNSDGPSDDD